MGKDGFMAIFRKRLTLSAFAIRLSGSEGYEVRLLSVLDVPLEPGAITQKKATFRVGQASIGLTR